MKANPLSQSATFNESVGIDGEAGRIVMSRAIELARLSGRSAIKLSKADWEQAKQEFLGNAG